MITQDLKPTPSFFLIMLLLGLSHCVQAAGQNSTSSVSGQAYPLSVEVINLAEDNLLVLQNNGNDDLHITDSGNHVFNGLIDEGEVFRFMT